MESVGVYVGRAITIRNMRLRKDFSEMPVSFTQLAFYQLVLLKRSLHNRRLLVQFLFEPKIVHSKNRSNNFLRMNQLFANNFK